MNNQLTTTNQNAKLALLKSKSLIDITNKLLANRPNKGLIESFENFRFSPTLGHTGSVNSIAITPDGKYVVSSGSYDKTIKLWDINSGQELRSFEGHTSSADSITPDGKYIVAGSRDNTIKLWDINSGQELRSFEGHTSYVNSVAITPDGKYVVSGSSDKTTKLWDINSGALHVSFASFDDNEWLSWKQNGEYNCSDGACKYFCFVDDSKGLPEVVEISHPVYKAKKKEILLSDYLK